MTLRRRMPKQRSEPTGAGYSVYCSDLIAEKRLLKNIGFFNSLFIIGWSAGLPCETVKHELLCIPELGRQVNIVIVRVLKALDLVPLHIHLFGAVFTDLLCCGELVDELSVSENRLLKLDCIEIRQGF